MTTPKENFTALIHNLMNHGYSEDHARMFLGMMADAMLSLPEEKLYILRAAHAERMARYKSDAFEKAGEEVLNAVNNETMGD